MLKIFTKYIKNGSGGVNMTKNLLILGAGGHGAVVKETALALGCYGKVDFLDDKAEIAIGKFKDIKNFVDDYHHAFVSVGNNEQRKKLIEELNDAGFHLPVLVHPTAYISPLVTIGKGSIVSATAVVNSNVLVETGCIISIGALVDHDSIVGEYSHINSGAVVKAGSRVDRLTKIDAGMVYMNDAELKKVYF